MIILVNTALGIILGYITFKDLREMIIPNKALLILGVIGLIYVYEQNISLNLLWSLISTTMIFGGLFILNKNSIGAGDVKLALVLSLWLNFPYNLMAWWLAFSLGGLVGSILLISKRRFKVKIPFAPLLILGMLLTYLWGEVLWIWWQEIILTV